MSERIPCCRQTQQRDLSAVLSNWGRSHPCTRAATYTDGKNFYCTQHAKVPATVLRKATGKIRDGLRRIES